MIANKAELKAFLQQDALAMGIKLGSRIGRIKIYLFNPRWKFIVLLRMVEYYSNSRCNMFEKIYRKMFYYKYKVHGMKLGFSIPPNVCGPGLSLPHYGTIVISKQAKIGRNCRIHVGVNIGANGGNPNAPEIGNDVYIGPGAKLFGDIKIGNGISIGANAVVNKSFTEENVVVGGIPAKILKQDVVAWWKLNKLELK